MIASSPTPTTPSQPNVLLVDDDPGLREEISRYLGQHGFIVHEARNALGIEPILRSRPVDLIILDVMMPGEDGLSVCRRLYDGHGPPVIIMSAMGDEVDRVLGLELGAHDYLAKPCSPRELVARIRSILRRGTAPVERRNGPSYEFSGFRLDELRRQLSGPTGVAVLLTAGEYALLIAFLEHPDRILTREELIEHAKGAESEVFDRSVDVQISRLRRKLAAGDERELIRTVRGRGYLFKVKVRRL